MTTINMNEMIRLPLDGYSLSRREPGKSDIGIAAMLGYYSCGIALAAIIGLVGVLFA